MSNTNKISPYGCKHCTHSFVHRCELTGHLLRWKTNAKYHCEHYRRDKRIKLEPKRA